MKLIDIRDQIIRKKGAISRETTIYLNLPYIGFSGKSGIGFVRVVKNAVKIDQNNRVKWYHSASNALTSAVAYVRQIYKLKMSVNGWEKFRVKHYNTTEVSEIVKELIKNLKKC